MINAITSWQIDGETMETVTDFMFLGSKITADGDSSHEIKRCLLLGRKVMTNQDSILKSRDITLPTKVHLVMYGCESWTIKSWVPKNWYFWIVVLEKTLESHLDCQEIQPVHSKGNQSWIFIGRTDTEAETPKLWPLDARNWLTGKDPDAGKDWRWEKKGTTENEMFGWHHWLNGHEYEQAPGVGDGQGSLAYCSPWGHKESDMTEWLNWTECSHSQRLPYVLPLCNHNNGHTRLLENSEALIWRTISHLFVPIVSIDASILFFPLLENMLSNPQNIEDFWRVWDEITLLHTSRPSRNVASELRVSKKPPPHHTSFCWSKGRNQQLWVHLTLASFLCVLIPLPSISFSFRNNEKNFPPVYFLS